MGERLSVARHDRSVVDRHGHALPSGSAIDLNCMLDSPRGGVDCTTRNRALDSHRAGNGPALRYSADTVDGAQRAYPSRISAAGAEELEPARRAGALRFHELGKNLA